MRDNLVPQKTGRQIAQLGHGFVMHPSLPGHINHSYGTDVAKEFEPLARGAFAELEAFDQVVHGQRASGNKEQPVDLGQRSRLPEQARELDEEVNDLRFQRAKVRRWLRLFGRFGQPFFFKGQYHARSIGPKV